MKKLAVAALLLLAIPLAQAQVLAPVPFRASALTNTVQTIKASRGVLQSGQCQNPNSTTVYFQAYDMTGTPVLGTTTPKITLGMLGTSVWTLPDSFNFASAIKIAVSTAVSGSGTPASTVPCTFGFN